MTEGLGRCGEWRKEGRKGRMGCWTSFLSVALIKHPDPEELRERKGFLWLILPGHGPSLKEVRAGTQDRSLRSVD